MTASTAPTTQTRPTGRRKRQDAEPPPRLIQGPPAPPNARLGVVLKAQRGLCFLCGKPVMNPTREHVIPRALGGWNYRNILAAHMRCNTAKAHRAPYVCELLYCAITYEIIG